MSERDRLLSIPKFDGDYEYWAMLMENLLRSKEWWSLIETGYTRPERGVILTGPQREELAQSTLKDLKVKNYLFASIDKNILKTILKKDTAKDLWDSMKRKYQGNERVQSAQLQRMRRNFEILEMKEGETITEYFSRVMMVVNDMRNLGEDMPDSKVVEKILRTLVEKFTYVVCAIEESKDIKDMSVDGLQSSLMVHEQKLTRHVSEDQALKVEGRWRSEGGNGRGGYQSRGRGRGGYQGRGRGSTSTSKEMIECYKCHKMGHYKNECPEWEKKANYAELEEDVLLMAYVETLKEEGEHMWFLDSGCSNHMCGVREWFVDFDETFRQNVKLGDDRRMMVEGRGNLRLEINGTIQLISSVYYVPGLKSNLMSIGQLQQKGLRIVIDEDVCEIWHKEQRRLLMRSVMSKNRLFVVLAAVKEARDTEEGCFQVTEEKMEDLWHKRLGHLSHSGMQSLVEKKMVNGLPQLSHNGDGGLCDICMRGKQNRENIPKKSSWRASRALQLVHTDICGPIAPTSASGKRYIINFIDDYSRKCWSFLLAEKSEALRAFKEFKVAAEREMGLSLVSLRSDRGGEYNSAAFQDYCRENGIKRQLTAAYTPQQNGIAERKNRSIMNMARCMMLGMSVPRRFWPEAVQYAVHVLNRSPSAALGDVTPDERWSNHKPSVEHVRVFGCVAYALVPYERRVKLDEKSIQCVFVGVSKESKAYRLYNPETKKIIISRDVRFDESRKWDWEESALDDGVRWEEALTNSEAGDSGENNGEEETLNQPEEVDPENVNAPTEVTQAETTTDQTVAARETSGRQRQTPVWMKDYVSGTAGEASFFVIDDDEALMMYTTAEDPDTFEEAVKSEKWRKAMEAEIGSIEENQTWELVEPPAEAKVIGVKWIFKTKFNEKGEVDKFKARLVAKGYHQRQGVDFHEVFAPVARWDTIRAILAKAAQNSWKVYQLDVKSAFLHGNLEEDVYIEQPLGFEVAGEAEKVYKLRKALYGLRQAPRAWYSRIEGYFEKEGFAKCYCEHTLFVKTEKEKILIVSLYVDDLIYTGNSVELLEEFKASMMREFSMTDLGLMKFFLGVEVVQDGYGIFINQQKYAVEILEKFGMENSNSVRNPIVPGQKLSKEGSGETADPTTFKQLIGSLRYLTATRPDLIYSVNLVSRFMEKPYEEHMLAAKRILRYVKGTTDFGIRYKHNGEEKLVGFVDSDYAGDSDDRKSTSGYVFMMSGGAISWASKKQAIVTLSTTEAEFVAAAYGACQGVWLRNVLEEIRATQTEGTILYCDNSSTIKLSKNPVMHGRSKHIHVRYHFLRDLVNEGTIQLDYCPTQDQLADFMTKAVKLETFEKLRSRVGVCTKEV
ncbi:unnamed protein product [Microthlaspi erraticum]|uniref:CCHC-type domain-containing protein n=1 Tax=Microthlaspi erraticum TaxID=1685480 RepID=A0A6D2IM54_9BRAS|nr:unnamed protein product [Microthlaspi erraticum]